MVYRSNLILATLSCAIITGTVGRSEASKAWAQTKGLTYKQARVAVTGYNVNRPDPYPGMGDFGWAGNLQRLPNGDLMLVHQWGYWHSSFAEPRMIEPELAEQWRKEGWPLDFKAPTGGRCMATFSSDNGKTWSKPQTIVDLPMDDSPYGLLLCKDGTLLCFISVQASWYGFPKAPPQFQRDINGLNTQQCVVRSTDDGKTWSEPIWLESPGDFYERSHAQPILLPDGGILWPTYFKEAGREFLSGALHRSDDNGKTWGLVSTIRREGKGVDEPAVIRLNDGRLFLVCRLDGGRFYSEDNGVNWTETGHLVSEGKFKAPRLFLLKDGTIVCVATYRTLCVFLGKDGGKSWSGPIPLDPSSYGYPGGIKLEDESFLVSYCSSGRAPNKVYVVRFKVNAARDGIELVAIGS